MQRGEWVLHAVCEPWVVVGVVVVVVLYDQLTTHNTNIGIHPVLSTHRGWVGG